MRKRTRFSHLSELLLEDRIVPSDFSNFNLITINDSGNATPYPSTIAVSGLTGQQITGLSVTFHLLNHDSPEDIDAMLIAPDGTTNIYLMSDCGGGADQPISSIELRFADSGSSLSGAPIVSGTFKPTNIDQGDPDTIPGAPA